MSASSSSHCRRIVATSSGAITSPGACGRASNLSSWRRVRSMNTRPWANVIVPVVSENVTTLDAGMNLSALVSTVSRSLNPAQITGSGVFPQPDLRWQGRQKLPALEQPKAALWRCIERSENRVMSLWKYLPENGKTRRAEALTSRRFRQSATPLLFSGAVECRPVTVAFMRQGGMSGRKWKESRPGSRFLSAYMTASCGATRATVPRQNGNQTKGRNRELPRNGSGPK